MKRLLILLLGLPTLALNQTVPATCGPKPPSPFTQTEAWAVQVSATEWRTEVLGWVQAPAPICWVPGRVELEYSGSADTPPVDPPEPGPWIEGELEWPMGTPCPEGAHGNCYLSPNKPKVPPAGCTSEFCVTP